MSKSRLSERCRACLESSEKMYPLVGTVVNVEVDIATMISYCTCRKLELSEHLPNSICLPCFKTIRIAYNFLQQFKESEDKLLKEQKAVRQEVDFNEMEQLDMTYSISEDGTELTEERIRHSVGDIEQDDDDYVDTGDNNLNITDSSYDHFNLDVIHNYAERNNANNNFQNTKVEPLISKEKYDINTEVLESDVSTDIKEETDSDSLMQYIEDPSKISNDIRAILEDATDPTSLDRFIIVNEPDEEVKPEEKLVQPTQMNEPIRCIYTCPLCNTRFDRLPKFNDHLLQHNRKVIVCNKCPDSTEFTVSQYIHHYRQFHRFECNICSKSLMSSYGYRYHMTQHENVRKYKCPVESCSKSFFLFHLLKKHMRTHSEIMRYTCNLCKAAFKTYDTFRYHQKTHDGKRNHLCTLCGKAFFQAVHLRDHMFRHIGFKGFTCDACGHSFTTNSQLKKHLEHCNKSKRGK